MLLQAIYFPGSQEDNWSGQWGIGAAQTAPPTSAVRHRPAVLCTEGHLARKKSRILYVLSTTGRRKSMLNDLLWHINWLGLWTATSLIYFQDRLHVQSTRATMNFLANLFVCVEWQEPSLLGLMATGRRTGWGNYLRKETKTNDQELTYSVSQAKCKGKTNNNENTHC